MPNVKRKTGFLAIALVAVLLVGIGASVGKFVYNKDMTKTSMDVANWKVTVGDITAVDKTYTEATLKTGKIAPGTSGKFTIAIDATGTDTGVRYTIVSKSGTNFDKPQNLKFYVMNGSNKVEATSLSDLATKLSGTIPANATSKSVTKEIVWEWAYETGSTDAEKATNNLQDTRDAETFETKNVEFTLAVNVDQVQPAQ